jgi:hypothetical protein
MNDKPPIPASDEHLMLAFSKGSTKSFNEFFLHYKCPVYGFFRRLTADSLTPKLRQEPFLVFLRAA